MSKTNLIIITADELRGDCVGFMGNPDVKTPNVDAFSQKGVVFTNHFTCFGKCVPSRIAMTTGRFSHTDGIRAINHENHIPSGTPDLLLSMRDQGYETAVFGINHVWKDLFTSNEKGKAYADYHSWTSEYEPFFDETIPVRKPGPSDRRPLDPSDYPELDMRKGFDYAGRIEQDIQSKSNDNIRAKQAVDYIHNTRDKSKPFYMHLNISAPHPPYKVEEPYFSMYDPRKITPFPHELPENASLPYVKNREIRTSIETRGEILRDIQATYYGMITKVDTLIGQVLNAVKDEGLYENTIVLFTSDHGDFASQYGLAEKWDTIMSDCLLKVPAVLWAPSLSADSGKRIDALTQHTDIAPTLFELLDVKPFEGMHGTSLTNEVSGKRQRKAVFADGGHEDDMLACVNQNSPKVKGPYNKKQVTYQTSPDTMARTKMVRTKSHKLVVRLRGGNELYDIVKDPHEMKNLYGDSAYNDVVMELQQLMIEWCLETDPDKPKMQTVGA